MAKRKKAKPKLLVVFDTSMLFSQVAHDLVCSEVKTFINANMTHPDLSIQWYFPRIVIDERRYQMRNKAIELLPSITKLETLLGHNLNITENILADRVNDAIEKQLGELQISKLDIDTTKVDWNKLIERAVNRHPPFEPGEKEKGFRDSLIAESFLQLVQQSPTTPSVCRLAIITSDNLLSKYITESTKNANNVRVLPSISDLGSLINTLVSQVTEEFVAEIKDKARKLFFEKENPSSLYNKENITAKIKELYGEQLKSTPKEGLSRENGTWWVNPPAFIKKDKQRIFWMTQINVDAEVSRLEFTEMPSSVYGVLMDSLNPANVNKPQYTPIMPTYTDQFSKTPKKVKIATGQSSFEIYWSINITQTEKLTSPRIDEIRFVATKWSE
jgi:hypothetical protein